MYGVGSESARKSGWSDDEGEGGVIQQSTKKPGRRVSWIVGSKSTRKSGGRACSACSRSIRWFDLIEIAECRLSWIDYL